MRKLVLALLFVNLAFAAWHAWFAGPPPATSAPERHSATETPRPRTSSADPPSAAAVASGCGSVGPFADLAQAEAAAARLSMAGYDALPRMAESDVSIGSWVYIALARGDDAAAALSRVREAGVTEAYLMPNTDGGSLLSLGLVRDAGAVSRLREQSRALGFEPQILDRTRRATVYWLDVPLADARDLDLDSLATPGSSLPLEQRACDGRGP